VAQPLSNLSIGEKVKFGNHQVNTEAAMPIIWTIVAKNHQDYPANAITLHTEKIIDLRVFDTKESNNTNGNRRNYGNNRYSVSNIDQWLNKDSAAGAWYVGQHTYDQAPSYSTRPGFLYHFSTEEKAAILDTTIRVVVPLVDGGGYDDITRKVFLPSTTEVGLGYESGKAEGTAWGFYTSDATRIAYLTAQAFDNTLSSSKPSAIDKAWDWWLRTPSSTTAMRTRLVSKDGTLSSPYAGLGYLGVRPALNLPSSILVSDTTDADGCYTFVWWTLPNCKQCIDGVWRDYSDGSVKIDGVWRKIDEIHTKIDGVWRKS
jgi:hypothetical protein